MTPVQPGEERDRFARAAFAADLVRRAAEALAKERIPVMPLKGALLQRLVYGDPALRPAMDVDLLVPEERFARAGELLTAAGFSPGDMEAGGRERPFRDPRGGPRVDLHRSVFAPGQFRLSTEDLFARGYDNFALFGAPVVVPEPLDLYAHLVGHFALHWLTTHELHHPEDFPALAEKLSLGAAGCAGRLRMCGLARAARYALPLVDAATPDPFARAVLRALGPDPIGDALAMGVRAVVPRLRPLSTLGLFPPNLLHRTPGSALRLLAGAARKRVGRVLGGG